VSRNKQKRTHHSDDFKRQALERMKVSENIVQLAKELGVARPLLYQWEAAVEGRGRAAKRKRSRPVKGERKPEEREAELQKEIDWLRAALIKKVKEADFFKSALQKVEERRRGSDASGERGFSTKSGK
jgi:transposase-like protein